jgi:hypothetical protein
MEMVEQVSLRELGCILVARSVAVNDTPAPLDLPTVRWEGRLATICKVISIEMIQDKSNSGKFPTDTK